MLTRLLCVGATLAVSGCVSFEPRAGFAEVTGLVKERVGGDAVWLTGDNEDAAVNERVRALLSKPLAPEDAVQIALLNNQELQGTYQELGIAQADVVQAGLLSNPTVAIERRVPGRALEADVAVGFLDVFLIPLRQRVAGAAFEAAKLTVSKAVIDHAFETRKAYFELQEKVQLVELKGRVATAAEASAESARRLREAGNVPALDVQRQELAAGQAELELAAAEGEVVYAREALNRLMGLWGASTRWTIPGRLPELPADDAVPERLEATAVVGRLDLAAARRELEGAAEGVGIAQIAALVPDLTLTGHYEREPEGSDSSGPSLELPLPLFNWGRAASGQARAAFEQARRRYTGLAVDIRSQVRAAYARMRLARASAAFYRTRVLPLQEQALRQTQLQFNGMLVGVFEVLEAKRGQVETAQKYVESLHDYWEARTELEGALGRTLPLKNLPPSSDPSAASADASHAHHHGHH